MGVYLSFYSLATFDYISLVFFLLLLNAVKPQINSNKIYEGIAKKFTIFLLFKFLSLDKIITIIKEGAVV